MGSVSYTHLDVYKRQGYIYLFNDPLKEGKGWLEKYYLYQVPLEEIALNPNLTQNPGWEDVYKRQLSVHPNAVISISYIGYITQNIKITNQTSLKVVMMDDTQALEEVVVVGLSLIHI